MVDVKELTGFEEINLTLGKEEVAVPSETNVTNVTLNEKEKQMVDEFAKKIDLSNSSQILQYGIGTQKKLADFSGSALKNVKTKDLGEVSNLLTGVITELKNFDKDEKKGIFGFLKKQGDKLSLMKTKYAATESTISEIVKVLNNHQIQLLKDVEVLDKMYQINLNYFKELTMYILAGKQKLETVRSVELVELKNKALATGTMEDAQAVRDLESLCDRFEKKLYDLELTRTVAMQTAPQIRLIQNNDTVMSEKIQSTIVNTIPLWKSQMVIALGVEHSLQAAKAQHAVTDLTNDLLKKNAEKLKIATIETAKESERGVVDIETLKHTNEMLISTFDEVLTIQSEGRQKRREAETELQQLENQLREKLLEVR